MPIDPIEFEAVCWPRQEYCLRLTRYIKPACWGLVADLPNGQLWGKLSVNVGGKDQERLVYIKSYSEGEGLIESELKTIFESIKRFNHPCAIYECIIKKEIWDQLYEEL